MTLPDDALARRAVPLHSRGHQVFPAALDGMARVSVSGSRQHHGNDGLYDDRSKSNDDADCLLRHLRDAAVGDGMDGDVPHIDKVLWRAARLSQKWHEAHGAPLAPAARNAPIAPGATNVADAATPDTTLSPVAEALAERQIEEPDGLKAGEAHEHDHAAYVAATADMPPTGD